MKTFIYVFSDNDKDTLLKLGFTLLKEDTKNSIYIFKMLDEKMWYDLNIGNYILSDACDTLIGQYCLSDIISF